MDEDEYERMKELWKWFRDIDRYPCNSVNTKDARACPKSGLGGCSGRYSECDREFFEKSREYRKLERKLISEVGRSKSVNEVFGVGENYGKNK